ncbi:MAG: glycosyltransferase family 2 protein, partial [Deltaproteobacteria bacterium]|nr:glycosyltransferase family 2 protein [Deltaproteobacteria bacterium]
MTPNTNAIIESSIIIPCGRPERAEASIRSVLKDVVGRNAEIIVVGQGVSMLNERLPSIICIDADRRLSPSQARNRGARSSRGEFLLFLDDDCEVVSGWYDNALHALKTYDQIGAV